MPKFDWDAPASQTFANLPSDTTFRVWVYRRSLVSGFEAIAKAITRTTREPCSTTCLRQAVSGIAKGKLHSCPKCGKPTTSQNRCASCTKSAQDGMLSDRERQRLQQHYALAHKQYAVNRDREGTYLTDDYSRG